MFSARMPCLFVVLATTFACSSTPAQSPATAPTPGPTSGPSAEELEALYLARADSALLNVSPADVRFMTGMIPHHAQALVMSGLAPKNGASPQIQTLAARIINAQKDEIALMQTWLRDRNQPVPEVHEGGHMMSHDMHMAGMLTPEQMEELEAAKGTDFDRTFLTFMIQHHEGAVSMVHELFATDGAAQDDLAFKLASDIQVDQITEVARMQSMLDAMPDPNEGPQLQR